MRSVAGRSGQLITAVLVVLCASTAGAQINPRRQAFTAVLTLAAPSGVTVAAARGGIAIGWQGVINAASYEIQRAPDATSAAAAVGTVPAGAVSFLDASMSARGPAWYLVVSVAADGRRAASGRVQLVTTAIAGTATLANTATLSSATPMASATTITKTGSLLTAVQPAPAPAPAPPPIDKTALSSRALAIAGTLTAAGAPPIALRAETAPTSIRLRWGCPTGATGYDVYVTPQGGGEVKLTTSALPAQCVQDLQVAPVIQPGMPAPTSTSATYSSSYTHSGLTTGSTLTYVVRALYPNGGSAASTPLTARALLVAPGGLLVSASGRGASLRWSPVTGATGYQVFRKLASQSTFQQLANAPASPTGYSDQSVLAPGQHQYYVQAVNGLPGSTVTLSMPPWPAPTGFVAASAGHAVSLSWKPVTGAPGYLVFRQLQSESGFQQLTPTALVGTTYQDNNLVLLLTDNYYVKTVDGDATAPASAVPGRPAGVQPAIYRGSSIVDFSWGGTDDATTAKLLRSTAPNGAFLDVTQVGATKSWARTDQGQVGATQYFKVQVTYLGIGQAESNVVTVTIPTGPQGITNLRATSPGPGAANLTWTCDPEATGYSLLRGKGTEAMDWIRPSGSTLPLVITQCQYNDTGLWNGATYRYTVAARYADRNTSADASISVVIAP